VFNPLPFERNEAPQVFIDFPREKLYRAFSIYDDQGQKVSHQVLSLEESYVIPIEPHELPTSYYTTKWKVAFEAKNLPALGFKTFTVKPEEGRKSNYGSQITATNTLENEFLKVKIEPNGTLTITDKNSGAVYPNLLWFEDCGESGDPWSRIPPVGDGNLIYNSLGNSAEIRQVCDGPLTTTFAIKIKMNLPAEVIRSTKKRSAVEKELPITTFITLHKGDPKLHLAIDLDNTIKDHRLRIMFDSGFRPEKSISSGQFDVLERAVFLPDTSDWLEPYTGTQPNNGGVWVENGKRGLAVLNFGLPEYEVFDNESGTVAMTLLRGFGYPKMSGIAREDLVERVGNEGSQCLGIQHYELDLFFYSGDWQTAGVLRHEREHKYPVMSVHHGRFAGKGLTKCESFLKIEPETLYLTALEKSESGQDYVARFYNPSEDTVEALLQLKFPVNQAVALDLNEEPALEIKIDDPCRIKITVSKKKIISVLLKHA
ncbi:MAG: hypothetical protein COT43_10215, partial [Candidatus Marinimicrobia bacterium CG08_land_8_20_14_0_20_45_22]